MNRSSIRETGACNRGDLLVGRGEFRWRWEHLEQIPWATRNRSPHARFGLLQVFLALGETAPALQLLENYCSAYSAGCNDLAINPIYQALHTDPRFERLAKKYTTVTLG